MKEIALWTRLRDLVRYHKIKAWLERYDRLLIPGSLVFGVVVDFITFRSIQITTTFIILGIHVCFALISIVLLNTDKPTGRLIQYIRLFAPFLLQFSFGALLSASLVFYWFSGTVSVSWPVLLLVAFLMTSNEVFRHYYLRPVVQLSVFFFAIFSIATLVFPYVFNTIDSWVFLVSGGLSVVLMLIFVHTLSVYSDSIKSDRSFIVILLCVIFLFMNGLYVLNIIPPIPLSLREAGVYHQVQRSGSGYILLDEEKNFLERLFPVQTIHLTSTDRTYVYTSIFAPAKLNTQIFHHWQYFDPESHKWIDKDRLTFSLSGGRIEGYRGYSFKSSLEQGKWRVNVETKKGQVLARIRFNIEHIPDQVPLVQIIR